MRNPFTNLVSKAKDKFNKIANRWRAKQLEPKAVKVERNVSSPGGGGNTPKVSNDEKQKSKSAYTLSYNEVKKRKKARKVARKSRRINRQKAVNGLAH